ncbi:MAG TPA: EAL domain-containing protein [Polyangia bacterium]|nr:EAL domain-containing protein [Polyangia bacterium]
MPSRLQHHLSSFNDGVPRGLADFFALVSATYEGDGEKTALEQMLEIGSSQQEGTDRRSLAEDQKRLLQELGRDAERYALAARASNDGLWDWDMESGEVYYSSAWCAHLGLAAAPLHGTIEDWYTRVHPDDLDSLKADLAAHLAGRASHFQHQHRLRSENGSYRWMLCRGLAVRDEEGRPYRMAGLQTDITSHKLNEAYLSYEATHDSLTGLLNRAAFSDRLGRLVDRGRRDKGLLFAVMYIDLDGFKAVNDKYGHPVGDQLLVALARRLEDSLRPGDVVARLGGDEFAVLLHGMKQVSDVLRVAERIRKSLAAPVTIGGHHYRISASLGAALSSTGYASAQEMLSDADAAMYRSKASGQGELAVCDEEMRSRRREHQALQVELRGALDRNELMLQYQPVVWLASGELVGFAAQLGWRHPRRGLIGAAELAALLEGHDVEAPAGRWALREVGRQLKEWQGRFPQAASLNVALGVSERQLLGPGVMETLRQALAETGLGPGLVHLEISESALHPEAQEVLLEIERLGVKIHIAEFGTGLVSSGLGYLEKLHCSAVKLDRRFVARLGGGEDPLLVRAVALVARHLGVAVIAEGVETAEQARKLRALDCSMGQGCYFGLPGDALAAGRMIADWRPIV